MTYSSSDYPPTGDIAGRHEADLARLGAGVAAYDAAIAELRAEEADPETYRRYWLDLLAEYDRIHRRLNDREAQ